MRMMRGIIAVVSVVFLWVSNAGAVNIVSNGSFETFTGSFGADGGAQLNPGDTTLTDWEIVNDEIAILQNGNQYNLTAAGGTRFLDLSGYNNDNDLLPDGKGVQQTLNLITNQNYVFSMDLGIHNGDCGGAFCLGPITVVVSIGNTLLSPIPPATLPAILDDSLTPDNVWRSFVYNFTANDTDRTLRILGVSGYEFIGLDNVSVEAIDPPLSGGPIDGGTVPEPSALILFASGLIGLAYWRHKQRA